ncbi:hypothetical protein [Streptomyces kasugaensis]|uniref:hypothetical protein n=1 Tax=Streptomyces kasugaensis TaxID=1946 RepID=UPI001F5F221E|nr:hypothetical protein [Streptomyces kasugaensis]
MSTNKVARTVHDALARTARQQFGTGRILPLGGPADGSWITERAAADALRAAVALLAGVRVGALRLSVADPGSAPRPAVPAPPSALPPGPLRITADFAATADRPLPATAARLRTALLDAAERELGLLVAAVDLRADGLLEPDEQDEPHEPGEPHGPDEASRAGQPEAAGPAAPGTTAAPPDTADTPGPAADGRTGATREGPHEPHGPDEASRAGQPEAAGPAAPGTTAAPPDTADTPGPAADGRTGATREGPDALAAAALAAPGVARLAAALGAPSRPVRLADGHALLQLATAAGHRPLDVARAVRAAVVAVEPGPETVAVLVTAVARG